MNLAEKLTEATMRALNGDLPLLKESESFNDGEFKLYINESDLDDVNKNSLLFDSGTEICSYTKDGYTLSLEVAGDIRIINEETGDIYKNYGHFPDDLISDLQAGKLGEDDKYTVVDNNWFEFFLDYNGTPIELDEVAEPEGQLNGEDKLNDLKIFMEDAFKLFTSGLDESKQIKTESVSYNDLISAGTELWRDGCTVKDTIIDGIYDCSTAGHGGFLIDTNIFPELAKYGDKTSIPNIVGFEEDYEALKILWIFPQLIHDDAFRNKINLDMVTHYDSNNSFAEEFPTMGGNIVVTEGIQDDRLQSTINHFKDLGYEVYKDGDNYKAFIKRDTQPILAMLYGKSAKPRFHYRFHNMEELDSYLDEYLKGQDEKAQYKADRRAQRKVTSDHDIKVGDIFYTYWGYDQTNSEFYEVIAVRGSRIDLRELACDVDRSGADWGQDKITPIPGKYVSDEIHTVSARADGTVTNLDGKSFLDLSKWDGRPIAVTSFGWGH